MYATLGGEYTSVTAFPAPRALTMVLRSSCLVSSSNFCMACTYAICDMAFSFTESFAFAAILVILALVKLRLPSSSVKGCNPTPDPALGWPHPAFGTTGVPCPMAHDRRKIQDEQLPATCRLTSIHCPQ